MTSISTLSPKKIRKDFLILSQYSNGYPLIYFDNAATTQKPKVVIKVLKEYYELQNSNIHRAQYDLCLKATEAFEKAREKVQQFINAATHREVIFTKGTTESINLVASCFGKKFLKKGDEIIISMMEHHSNIVPWQIICEEKGAILKVIPINDKGELSMSDLDRLISSKTKLISICHISNTLGTINPVKKIVEKAHTHGIAVFVDGAQAAPHIKVDMQELDCDFYAFSGHKLYGPTGIGVLYGKEKWLREFPPYQSGGDMIENVSFECTTYADIPHKFEAGTPNIAGVLGLASAIDYLLQIGMASIEAYESQLLNYATNKIACIDNIRIIGEANHKAGILSFIVNGIHPSDIGILLDQLGIAIRTGYHCTEPIMDRFSIPGTARISFAFYNTIEEVDIFMSSLERILKMLMQRSV